MTMPETATEDPSADMQADPPGSSPMDVAIEACHEPLRAAWRELAERASKGLLVPLESGLTEHAAIVKKIGLDGDPPDAWRERADAALEYRKVVDDALLEPLAKGFDAQGPAGDVLPLVSAAVAELDAASRDLPKTVASEWPGDALAPKRSDAFGRRLGKIPARLFSAARKSGAERTLPLRAAVVRHARGSVAPAADALASETVSAWLEWSRRLEQIWVEWGDRALPSFARIEESDEDDSTAAWSELAEAAGLLHVQLEDLAASAPSDACSALVEARLSELGGELAADLAVAGSFVYRPDVPEGSAPELKKSERRSHAVETWEEGVAARLEMYLALLGILAGASAVQRRLVWRFRERCVQPLSGLPATADGLDQLARGVPDASSITAPVLDEIQAEVERVLAPAIEAVPSQDVIDTMVYEGSDATVDALLGMIRQAPTALRLHDESEPPPRGARPADTRNVALQDLARQSFDALRIERIRSATAGLVDAVAHVRSDIEELPDVFQFAHDEATRELEGGGEEAGSKARDLVTEALGSMSESLRGQLRALDGAVADSEGRLADEVSAGSSALFDRVAAGRMQARLLAARSRVADLRQWINDEWGPPVDRAAKAIGRRFAILRRLASRGVRKGTAIVGGTAPGTGSTRAIRRLAAADEVVEGLPIVYQRLFTLDPLSDPALLAGREGALADTLERWRRWREKDGVPLIVRGRPGSGITTFLNVFGKKVEEDGGSIARVGLDARVSEEEPLARILADGLGLGDVTSLDDLASAVFDAKDGDLPAAVAVDNLEHVYLRVPGGTALIERLLTLMAETEPRILWIGGVTSSAWQLVASAEPTAVSQVDIVELEPLTAEATRAAITKRHRRSGLPVRFPEPSHGRLLLRRRLRRSRDPAAYQELLEDDFFEQLHRVSGGHLPLALFEWLDLADFDSGEGVVLRTPERPDFSVLESLDLTQNFTLKAFVEHHTLTLEEHDRVFRLPRQESYQIFESLGNRSLIVPVGTNGTLPVRSEIGEGLRYRVPSLLTGTVIGHLQGLNIVH